MRLITIVVGLALCTAAPEVAHGQAYVGEENTASMDLSYTYGPSGKILADEPFVVPKQIIHSHIVVLGADYVTPLPGLEVEAQLNLVGNKLGEETVGEHAPRPGPWDDKELHVTPTDARLGIRYQIKPIERIVGLSLAVAASAPTHDYPTSGLVAPAHGLKAVYLGGAIARTLDPILPRLFIAGNYEYAIREKVDVNEATEKFSRNYSDIAANMGYFVTDALQVSLGANWRVPHGGVSFIELLEEDPEVVEHHDQLLRESAFLVGGDVGYQLTDKFFIGAGVRFFVDGVNTRNQNLYGLSTSYQLF